MDIRLITTCDKEADLITVIAREFGQEFKQLVARHRVLIKSVDHQGNIERDCEHLLNVCEQRYAGGVVLS
jgi:hypothetical protein